MEKRKLTLAETWQYCLEMWKWIAGEVEAGRDNVERLKAEWLRDNGFRDVYCRCFFCDCTRDKDDCILGNLSKDCPGRMVDPEFDCQNHDYQYQRFPIKFYKKIVQLNRKRSKKWKS